MMQLVIKMVQEVESKILTLRAFLLILFYDFGIFNYKMCLITLCQHFYDIVNFNPPGVCMCVCVYVGGWLKIHVLTHSLDMV